MTMDEALRYMGLSHGASEKDIQKAYRQLAVKYHPDRGGDEEKMKLLNIAREIVESGGKGQSTSHESTYRNEEWWEKFRAKFGPFPSGKYTDADLRKFAEEVFKRGFLQTIIRHEVSSVPVDAWGVNERRPFGGKQNTSRIPENITPEKLYEGLKRQKGSLFDIFVEPHEAWVTWERDGRKFQTISFEKPKVKVKKDPRMGKTVGEITEYLKNNGLAVIAGGSKNQYWGPRGSSEKTGRFIRQKARSLRLIIRSKVGRAYEDGGIQPEVYFGKITTEQLDEMIRWVKR